MRQEPRAGNESDDVNRAGNETRQDILNVCRRADAPGFNRCEWGNSGAGHNVGILITLRSRAAGTRMFESDG